MITTRPKEKRDDSQRIAEQIKAFTASGGKIEVIQSGECSHKPMSWETRTLNTGDL